MTNSRRLALVWTMLIIPPILLLLLTTSVAMTVAIKTQGDSQAIKHAISSSLPYVLMVKNILLFLILLGFLRVAGLRLGDIGWKIPQGSALWLLQCLIGVAAGALLGFLDLYVIAPLSRTVALRLGVQHYLSSSNASMTQGSSLAVWLITLILLAPIVEESIYRGYAITQLRDKIGLAWAVVVPSLFFGLLHWGLGLDGMINAVLVGALLAGLFLWRRMLIAPAVAHAVVNLMALWPVIK